MHSYPSRAERREIRLYSAAERGHLSLNKEVLYSGEIARLRKQGFTVNNIVPYSVSGKLYMATIDWSHAFGQSIPHLVYSYINMIIETYPRNSVKSFAQELYVIAQRANRK